MWCYSPKAEMRKWLNFVDGVHNLRDFGGRTSPNGKMLAPSMRTRSTGGTWLLDGYNSATLKWNYRTLDCVVLIFCVYSPVSVGQSWTTLERRPSWRWSKHASAMSFPPHRPCPAVSPSPSFWRPPEARSFSNLGRNFW